MAIDYSTGSEAITAAPIEPIEPIKKNKKKRRSNGWSEKIPWWFAMIFGLAGLVMLAVLVLQGIIAILAAGALLPLQIVTIYIAMILLLAGSFLLYFWGVSLDIKEGSSFWSVVVSVVFVGLGMSLFIVGLGFASPLLWALGLGALLGGIAMFFAAMLSDFLDGEVFAWGIALMLIFNVLFGLILGIPLGFGGLFWLGFGISVLLPLGLLVYGLIAAIF